MVITIEFLEGLDHIRDVFESCRTEAQLEHCDDWANDYVMREREYQKKNCKYLSNKKIDSIFASYFAIIAIWKYKFYNINTLE